LISLDIPSEGGSGASRPRRAEEVLGPLGEKLSQRIKPEDFQAWFGNSNAKLVSQTDNTVTLAVSSKFYADQLMIRYESAILDCAGVDRLIVETNS
jgi:hypothetical protein